MYYNKNNRENMNNINTNERKSFETNQNNVKMNEEIKENKQVKQTKQEIDDENKKVDFKVIGVRFRKTAKLEYYYPLKYKFSLGDSVIAETERGEELGRVVQILDRSEAPIVDSSKIASVLRPGSRFDQKQYMDNQKEAENVKEFAQKSANKLNLKMKFLLAEYTLNKSKITLYFTSEDRVDFRELVKIIASTYRSRIELRQIGPRDEIKIYPNLGMCGREVCCRTNLEEFESVTIKDAKDQGLQINMSKISGACGKLMCCLKYEEESYRENLKDLPKYGDKVKVKETKEVGYVTKVNILSKNIRVKFMKDGEIEKYENYDYSKLEVLNKGV